MRRLGRILPVVAVSIAASVVVLAQQPQVFRAGTRSVLVDVAVKDGNRPILGLTSLEHSPGTRRVTYRKPLNTANHPPLTA